MVQVQSSRVILVHSTLVQTRYRAFRQDLAQNAQESPTSARRHHLVNGGLKVRYTFTPLPYPGGRSCRKCPWQMQAIELIMSCMQIVERDLPCVSRYLRRSVVLLLGRVPLVVLCTYDKSSRRVSITNVPLNPGDNCRVFTCNAMPCTRHHNTAARARCSDMPRLQWAHVQQVQRCSVAS